MGASLGYSFAGFAYSLTPSFVADIIYLHPDDAERGFFTAYGLLFQRHRYVFLLAANAGWWKSANNCVRLMGILWVDQFGTYDRAVVFLCIVASAFTRFSVGHHDELLMGVCASLVAYILFVQRRQEYLERLQRERQARNAFPHLPQRLARQLSVESASDVGDIVPTLARSISTTSVEGIAE